MMQSTMTWNRAFPLESGEILPRLEIAYTTRGHFGPATRRVIWICHALTGNADPTQWWPGMVDVGGVFDPRYDFVVCANVPGSCYGSSGPLSIDPGTGRRYYAGFPTVTVRDMVRTLSLLRKALGISRIDLCVGGSMGGQVVLEWAVTEPEIFDHIAPIATNARMSAWGIALDEAQRLALEADPTWNESRPDAGANGLAAARAIAMITYRNYQILQAKQDWLDDRLDNYPAASYVKHHGEKLAQRFNAQSYRLLTKAMDSHDIGRGRGGIRAALGSISAKATVIGISSDVLFPTEEQRLIARHIPRGQYVEIDSGYGHDGFLVESRRISEIIAERRHHVRGKSA